MKTSIVLSVQPAKFEAVAFKSDLKTNLKAIKEMGYDGVELAIRDPKMVDAERLKALVQAHGLMVSAIGTGQAYGEEGLSFTDPDKKIRKLAVERILDHLPLASSFRAEVIIGLIRGTKKPGVTEEQMMDWLLEALGECCQKASDCGVALVIEPINRYETSLINTVEQGLMLIESLGVERLGLLLDTFHMNIEEPSIHESIQKAKDRLFHFHVADSNRRYPGAGHLDFAAILKRLMDIGYEGFVSGEFLPCPDAHTAARQALNTIKRSMLA